MNQSNAYVKVYDYYEPGKSLMGEGEGKSCHWVIADPPIEFCTNIGGLLTFFYTTHYPATTIIV